MNQRDVGKLLLVVAARYPTAKLLDQGEELTVQAWHMTLDDVPYPAAELALVEWFKREKWAPDPSEIREGAFRALESCRTDEERERLEPGWMAQRERIGAPVLLALVPEHPEVVRTCRRDGTRKGAVR